MSTSLSEELGIRVDEEERNRMLLLQELKRSKQKPEQPNCENKLLGQTTEEMWDSAV